MHRKNVFLLIGTNMGDRRKNIGNVHELLEASGIKITEYSSVYETEPWGFSDPNPFLNQAVQVETGLDPVALLNDLLRIEKELGRSRISSVDYVSRIVDIDILFFDDVVMVSNELIIPHPRIPQRRFVLEPMVEIASDFIHPVQGKKMKELLEVCDDSSSVIRL